MAWNDGGCGCWKGVVSLNEVLTSGAGAEHFRCPLVFWGGAGGGVDQQDSHLVLFSSPCTKSKQIPWIFFLAVWVKIINFNIK